MNEFNKVDLGAITIHKNVIAEIALVAIKEIEGVSLISKDFKNHFLDLIGIKSYPGLCVNVDKNNQVNIDVKIRVRYGMNMLDIAKQAQDAIRSALEKVVEIDLKDINISIHGIERGQESFSGAPHQIF